MDIEPEPALWPGRNQRQNQNTSPLFTLPCRILTRRGMDGMGTGDSTELGRLWNSNSGAHIARRNSASCLRPRLPILQFVPCFMHQQRPSAVDMWRNQAQASQPRAGSRRTPMQAPTHTTTCQFVFELVPHLLFTGCAQSQSVARSSHEPHTPGAGEAEGR